MCSSDLVIRWHGENTEVMHFVAHDLSAYEGRECRVRVYDRASGPWGHVIADHFMLVAMAAARPAR